MSKSMQYKVKIFLSYCSKDKAEKDQILNFLMPMIEETAEIWHDQKLLAGDKFDDKIKQKLSECDVFLFVVTQEFLNSSYCKEVEVDAALNRKAEEDGMRIIPIILDYCTFTSSKLAPYNAVPQKASPIKSFENLNKAYLEVANSISEVVEYILSSHVISQKLEVQELVVKSNELNKDFRKYLNELGFTIQHSNKDVVTLDDLFVYPDLKRLKYDFDDYDVYKNSKDALNIENVLNRKILIIGEEQSGKSTLAKVLFKDYHFNDYTPVLIKGELLKKTSDFRDVVQSCYESQYVNKLIGDSKKIILIIDDITESPINERYKRVLLASLKDEYENLIIISDSKIRFSEHLLKDFESFDKYDISNLGHTQRSEFVEKWNSIGQEESVCLYEQQSINDNLKRNIDSILMKNIVPSKPVFLLMILQILESNTPNSFALSSYGHCYHSLIVQAFSKANVRVDEMSDYFNYLSELAFYIFIKGNSKISLEGLEEYKSQYSENYYVSSHEDILNKLVRSKLISIDYEKVSFHYKYIYYFFVAKKISDMSNEDALVHIDNLSKKIHTEKHANVLIFLTHHTKDKPIIDRICNNLRGIFSNQKEATLGKENVSFLNEMAGEIPKIVIDKSKDVERERKEALAEQDKKEREVEYTERSVSNDEADSDEWEEDVQSINKDLIDVNRSYKAVEILGQIIRNRKGSLPIPQLEKLGVETYSVGFRYLDFYYSITKELKEEIISEVQRIIADKKHWSTERITKEARVFYWTYSYMMSLNVIRKISYSIGHKDLTSYYEKLSDHFGTEISKLVEISIKLEFTKKIPKDEIIKIWPHLKDNLMTRRLLQEIVITHLHMHYTNHEDKAWIASKLSIPIKEQINLQKNSALPLKK